MHTTIYLLYSKCFEKYEEFCTNVFSSRELEFHQSICVAKFEIVILREEFPMNFDSFLCPLYRGGGYCSDTCLKYYSRLEIYGHVASVVLPKLISGECRVYKNQNYFQVQNYLSEHLEMDHELSVVGTDDVHKNMGAGVEQSSIGILNVGVGISMPFQPNQNNIAHHARSNSNHRNVGRASQNSDFINKRRKHDSQTRYVSFCLFYNADSSYFLT
jgi:hypothetical protein